MLTTRSNERSASSLRLLARLELEILQAELLRAPVPGLDEVARDVDTQHVRAELRRGHRGGSVSASEIEHLDAARHAELADERLAALAHARGDAREVALLPQCLVRIHGSVVSLGLDVDAPSVS
jgi:hypothetical protein